MPRAFFGTFFRFERKYCPPRGGSPTNRAVVGASDPQRGFPFGEVGVQRRKRGAFRSPSASLRIAYQSKKTSRKMHLRFRTVVGASGSTEDFFGNAIVHRSKQGLSFE